MKTLEKEIEITEISKKSDSQKKYNGFYKKYVKRAIDFVLCVLILPFWLLLFLPIAIAIKIDDGGPVFYIDERIGQNSKKLRMYKFRSMKVGAEYLLNADGSTYNSENDERVTRVGRFLRVTSLDETPQILNILKNEMSFIGPRASKWSALPTYKEDEFDKMKVLPGITGYTQAYYRNSIGVREKRLLDADYAHNISFKLDIKIVFRTVKTVLKRENIYTNK